MTAPPAPQVGPSEMQTRIILQPLMLSASECTLDPSSPWQWLTLAG